ncbi:MAG: MFS transporter [Pseudonocardiales bacterium]|nr:MFS transporter [Pseudonocardiales bacterium]
MRHGNGRVLGLLAVAASWGLFWGGWAALIPEIKAKLALTDQQLGLALFAIPIAAVPAMLGAGWLVQRLAQYTLPLVTAAFALGIVLTGWAPSPLAFTVALLVVGGSSGMIEVALNATTAAQEATDGQRLFNKVHAATPLAMVAAAPAVGLARKLGASSLSVLVVIAVLVAGSAVLALDSHGGFAPGAVPGAVPGGSRPRQLYKTLLLVGAVGATVLLMENAVEQWSALHLEQQLSAGPLLASIAPTAYMAGLSAGRMLTQWRGARYSDRALVALGGTLGAVGLAIGATAAHPSWALLGFALAGIGLAPVVPTLLSVAGRAVSPARRSTAISLVTMVCYAGFLLSPPLVGTLAGWLGLSTALGLVALGGTLVAAGAQVVRLLPSTDPAQHRGPSTTPSAELS